ncbi:EH signature domain-containing protein [Methylosinus sp. KRF6]|uniref:EH signature domain-containing protein n=1 Tax=Methylosinus sp. KRF6 TaxID=2846853 RepID=UPI001C0E5649|nr:EH signature domain-containing protein [Methylosinus sp. KRF6]MBU3888561.1 hypothetical protein [Methylosinus sp. KRF6]
MKLENLSEFTAPARPALDILVRAKNRILDRWPDVVSIPQEKDRERLVQEVDRRRKDDQWDDTPMSLVASAAVALFDEKRQERRELSELREFYYAESAISTQRVFIDSMLSVYVGSYRPGADHTKRLAAALAPSLAHAGARARRLIENIPDILDPLRAPQAIAAKMTQMADCWMGLKELGLRSPHAPGVMDHAHLAFVESMRPALKTRAGLERLLDWLKPSGQAPRTSGAAEAITAAIDPWLTRDPPENEISFITERLQSLYGDPRVTGGGAWAGVPSEHLAVLMRWLTGENIRFFLDVVSEVEASHMWAPRRNFWLSLHEAKRIDAAWVAFSGKGAALATSRLRAGGARTTLAFGRQIAGGNRADTSLLILKIGKRIIVEGSHNYKVHIFNDGNALAPKLYQQRYDCDDIRQRSNAEKPHLGDWQGWVLNELRKP